MSKLSHKYTVNQSVRIVAANGADRKHLIKKTGIIHGMAGHTGNGQPKYKVKVDGALHDFTERYLVLVDLPKDGTRLKVSFYLLFFRKRARY